MFNQDRASAVTLLKENTSSHLSSQPLHETHSLVFNISFQCMLLEEYIVFEVSCLPN